MQHDELYLIPTIQWAQKLTQSGGGNHTLNMFFSPWSPPAWMKVCKIHLFAVLKRPRSILLNARNQCGFIFPCLVLLPREMAQWTEVATLDFSQTQKVLTLLRSASCFICEMRFPDFILSFSPPLFNFLHLLGSPYVVHQAWALFFIKFIDAYATHVKNLLFNPPTLSFLFEFVDTIFLNTLDLGCFFFCQGIKFWGATVQNEPANDAKWEACCYKATEEQSFVRDYLGPILQQLHPEIKLMIWDHNRDVVQNWAQTILSDPETAKFVAGTAFHWYTGNSPGLNLYDNLDVSFFSVLVVSCAQPN